MTMQTETHPLLFGEPYSLDQQDCENKLRRFAALVLPENDADNSEHSDLPLDAVLLEGCLDAFGIIKKARYNARRVADDAQKHLLKLLLTDAENEPSTKPSQNFEAIGFTTAVILSNKSVPANTNDEVYASVNNCLSKACRVCLILEQEVFRIATASRESPQQHAHTIAVSHTTNTPATSSNGLTKEIAAALSLSRSRGRQNAS